MVGGVVFGRWDGVWSMGWGRMGRGSLVSVGDVWKCLMGEVEMGDCRKRIADGWTNESIFLYPVAWSRLKTLTKPILFLPSSSL